MYELFRRSRVSILALIVSVLSGPLQAATYYVDFASGSDSNPGTSETSPWKRCPGDPNATGVTGSVNLQPGDIVLFRSGVVYLGNIKLNWSGSSGAPISYIGNSWGGTARAIITTQNSSGTAVSGSSQSHIVFSGFEVRDIGGYAENDPIWNTTAPVTSPPGGTGVGLTGGANILISDCLFAEIGQWQNKVPMSGTTSVTGNGISLEDNTGITIANCEFTRTKIALSIKAKTAIRDIIVTNCNFHNYLVWCIDVAPRAAGATLSNILIVGNNIHDYTEFDSANWKGYDEKPHTDGVFLRTAGIENTTWSKIRISRNRFYSTATSGGGTASIYLSQGASAMIDNNLFFNQRHPRTIAKLYPPAPGTSHQLVEIYNNTFYDSTSAINLRNTDRARTTVRIKNNIFFRQTSSTASTPIFIEDGTSRPTECDYNVYYVSGHQNVWRDNSTYRNLNSVKSLGFDAHSVFGNPQFISTSGGLGANSLNNNLSLSSGSPAIGRGFDLSSLFNTDFLGLQRQNPWDIGAYEFQSSSGGTLPAAPSALNANAVSATRIDLSWRDNSGNESGFLIERSLASTSGFEQIDVVGANVTSYSDLGLAPATRYYYRIRSFNAGGTSAYTSTTSATTRSLNTGNPTGVMIPATDGVISAPFEVTQNYISQTMQTTDLSGGRAVYSFNVTTADEYSIAAVVDTAGEDRNSFFVNIDAEPLVPQSVWHVPVTDGFEVRTVSWQGAGTPASPELVPKYFYLEPGTHEVIVRGREMHAKLASIALIPRSLPAAPSNLRIQLAQ